MAGIPNSAGAFDFSALRQNATQNQQTQTPTDAEPSSASVGPTQVAVPSLVLEADSSNLRNYLQLSASVPLLVDLYTVRVEASVALSEKLIAEVVRRAGQLVLLRIDADRATELAQAFQVSQLPAVVGLLKNQPVPLFTGDQPAENIALVLDKLLEVAASNGVVGTAIPEANEVPELKLPPRHQAAADAIDRGDYAAAVAEFEAALAEAPADALAAAGLAQAKLLQRTVALDYEAVLANEAPNLQSALNKADALASIGEFAAAFTLLLDRFESEFAERDTIRPALLELFKVAGPDEPAVSAARARLTNLLY